MSTNARYGSVPTDEPAKSASAEGTQTSSYRYIIGAVLVVMLLVLVLTIANPSSIYDYLAVTGHSLRESDSSALKAARVSVEVQTLFLLTSIVVGVIFWSTRAKGYLGHGVLATIVALSLGLLVFRTVTALHLNIFFWILAVLYLLVGGVAAYCAFHFLKGRKDMFSAIALGAISLLFIAMCCGAVSVAVVVDTGDVASEVIHNMENIN